MTKDGTKFQNSQVFSWAESKSYEPSTDSVSNLVRCTHIAGQQKIYNVFDFQIVPIETVLRVKEQNCEYNSKIEINGKIEIHIAI